MSIIETIQINVTSEKRISKCPGTVKVTTSLGQCNKLFTSPAEPDSQTDLLLLLSLSSFMSVTAVDWKITLSDVCPLCRLKATLPHCCPLSSCPPLLLLITQTLTVCLYFMAAITSESMSAAP